MARRGRSADALDRRHRRDPRPRARLGPFRGRHRVGLPRGPPVPGTHRHAVPGRRDPALGARPRLRPALPPAPPAAARGRGHRWPVHLRRAGRDDPARPVAPAVGGHARRRPARRRGCAAVQAQPRPLRRDGPRAAAGRAALAHPGAHHRQAPAARPDGRGPDPVPGAHAAGPQRPRSRRRGGARAARDGGVAGPPRPCRAGRPRLRRLGAAGALAAAGPAAAGARAPQPVLALPHPRRAVRRPARGGEGGRRLDQRLLPRVAARGVPPLLGPPGRPAAPGAADAGDAAGVGAPRGARGRRQPLRARPALGPGRHRRPGRPGSSTSGGA